ncbi:MAG: hypothetical protein JNN07_00830 [Verrucomicrobiales bacterium]|nr:hypothetical protein [Verrucomicrobiales bacterium]
MAAKVKKPRSKGARDRGASVTGCGSDDGFAKIRSIAVAINRLQLQNAETLDPVVQHLIRIRSRDVQEIEHTLDQLLDCACVPKGLEVFKSLCRYYFKIDPVATAYYIHAYRDMWDSKPDQEKVDAQ